MSGTDKPEQTTVNGTGTVVDIDTRLTRESSRPVHYELIDKDGRVDSRKFESATQLAEWARFLWPDQEQDPDRTGKGWDIQVCE